MFNANKKAYDHAFLPWEVFERSEFLIFILVRDALVLHRKNPPLFHLIRKEVDGCLNDGILDARIVADSPAPSECGAARHIQMSCDFSVDRRFEDRSVIALLRCYPARR